MPPASEIHAVLHVPSSPFLPSPILQLAPRPESVGTDYLYWTRFRTSFSAATFVFENEAIFPYPPPANATESESDLWREGERTTFPKAKDDSPQIEITEQISVLSQVPGIAGSFAFQLSGAGHAAHSVRDLFERFSLYREWTFGAKSTPRSLEQAGRETGYLEEDNSNLAHVLNFILTHQDPEPARKLREAFGKFSGDAKDVETRIQEGFVQLRVRESSGISIPAIRLSDGTLRWLALLAILLNPAPPPVTCIDEPELGLHPDILPTLADLLVEASTRTQLIVTTHSSALVDAFSDDPESVCVCEKVDGSTVIRRLARERLEVWLKDYSLGHLWASGEIGGNRW
jgi:hypothetical protein